MNPLEWEMPKLLVYATLFCIVFSQLPRPMPSDAV